MSRYIAWCLVELETRLSTRLNPTHVQDVLSEFEAHLLDAKQAYIATGLNDSVAELKAVQDFGRPSVVADETLEALSFHPTSWLRRNLSTIGIGLAYGAVVVMLLGVCFFSWDGPLATTVLAMAVAAGTCFLVGKKAYQKLMLAEMLSGAAVCFVALLMTCVYLFVNVPGHEDSLGTPLAEAKKMVRDAPDHLSNIQYHLADLKRHREIFAREGDAATAKGALAIVTTFKALSPDDIYSYPLQVSSNISRDGIAVRDYFEKTAPKVQHDLEKEITRTRTRVAGYSAALAERPHFNIYKLQQSASAAFTILSILLGLNAFTLLAAWAARTIGKQRVLRA